MTPRDSAPEPRRRPRPARVRGMTLVELLIALLLSIIILLVVATTFSNTSLSRESLERAARLMDNAGYALNLLQEEARVAGFYDAMSYGGGTWVVPDPCATAIGNLGWSRSPFTVPVATTGLTGGDATPACLPNRKAGTDILVLRRLSADATAISPYMSIPYIQVSKCNSDPLPWVISNRYDDFVLHDLDCSTPAAVRAYLMRIYYVATCDDCGRDTIPTLKRAELRGTQIVVESVTQGVEDLQVEYGFDADNDGLPDRFLATADATLGAAYGEWSNVTAARIHVLARSADVEAGYKDTAKTFNLGAAGYTDIANDGYKRMLLTSLVRLPNIAGRRETP